MPEGENQIGSKPFVFSKLHEDSDGKILLLVIGGSGNGFLFRNCAVERFYH